MTTPRAAPSRSLLRGWLALTAGIAAAVLYGMATGFDRAAPMGMVETRFVVMQFSLGAATLVAAAVFAWTLVGNRGRVLVRALLAVLMIGCFVAWLVIRTLGYSPH